MTDNIKFPLKNNDFSTKNLRKLIRNYNSLQFNFIKNPKHKSISFKVVLLRGLNV